MSSSAAAGQGTVTCPGCEAPTEESRCGHCGVALRAGGYRVLRVLSQGPHARLYLAEDEEGRRVALKELLFALLPSTEQLDAFEREAALLRELRHPRIPRFVRGFTEGSGVQTRMYLAQEYVHGDSLARELERHRFTEEEVRAIADEVLEILDYLHRLSPIVLHRDVKPANLVRGADGRLVLVDFGAARLLSGAQTHRATLVGTFGYMPPEQLGGTVDPRSDLYALGATLIHLLAGKPPEAMLRDGLTLDFRRHVESSAHLEQFLARLVARKPEDRFASARVARAFLRGESTRPGLRRNVLGFSVSLGIALLMGGVVLSRQAPSDSSQVAQPVQDPARSTTGTEGTGREEYRDDPVQRPPDVDEGAPTPPPRSTRVTFNWIMAHWELGRPGRWVQDTSGRDHHGLVPARGIRGVFGGLEFMGGEGVVEIPDHPELAIRAPFTLDASTKFLSFDNERGVIFRRGDESGQEAVALETRPGGMLRFTIGLQGGGSTYIEGLVPPEWKTQLMHTYATLNEHGEMKLYVGCALLATGQVSGEPRVDLNPAHNPSVSLGGVKGKRHGFHGEIWNVKLQRGVMEKQSGDRCSFSLRMAR